MQTNYVAPDSSQIQLDTTPKGPNQELDKDVFMELMITQLQYQDPLNPMDNQEMLAQMAQFTALEQMKNVADVTQKQYAQQMIGDFVEYSYKDPETNQVQYLVGKVDYIKNQGSTVLLGVGGHEIAMDDIIKVLDPNNIQSDTSAFELIGQTVQGMIERKNEETGKLEQSIIEGEVLQVHMKDDEPFVVLGTGKHQIEVALDEVQNIVDKPSLTNKYVTGVMTQKDEAGNVTEVEITGKVEYIVMQEEDSYLYVNGQHIHFEDIKSVYNQDPKNIESKLNNTKYNY